jgi:hypothetical protein
MSISTDPPSNERKTASVRRRVRGLCRKLVNRHTLGVAIQIVNLTVKVVNVVRLLFGDL